MKRLYILFAVSLLCLGVSSSASVLNVPSAEANVTVMIAGGEPAAASGEWFGSSTIQNESNDLDNYTMAEQGSACPSNGSITAIDIYVTGAVTGADFGCMAVSEGNGTISSGHYVEGINLSDGLNELTAPDDFTAFTCSSGEYATVYIPSGGGGLDYVSSGRTGLYNDSGDNVPMTDNPMDPGTGYGGSFRFYVE